MVSQGNGLGLLHMGVTRHDCVQVVLCDGKQCADQLLQHRFRFPAGGLGIHPGVQRHLVIPAPAGMQALAGVADALCQQGLHVHVDILRVHHPLDLSCPRVFQNVLQAGHDFLRVCRGDDPLLTQHGRVGNGSGNILFKQPFVKRDAGMEIIHQPVGCLFEPSSPKLHTACLLQSLHNTNIVHKTTVFAIETQGKSSRIVFYNCCLFALTFRVAAFTMVLYLYRKEAVF